LLRASKFRIPVHSVRRSETSWDQAYADGSLFTTQCRRVATGGGH